MNSGGYQQIELRWTAVSDHTAGNLSHVNNLQIESGTHEMMPEDKWRLNNKIDH